MRIIDGNGSEKEAVSLRVITHEVKDAVNKGVIPTEFVEATIKGKNRLGTWTEWYPLVEFQINNPNIKV